MGAFVIVFQHVLRQSLLHLLITGNLFQLTLTATDPDGGSLAFSATNLPADAAFDPATQLFTWTPTLSDIGTFADILFTVTDNGFPPLADMETISITVVEVIEALMPLAQPELLRTDPREADVVDRREADSETETLEVPVARALT